NSVMDWMDQQEGKNSTVKEQDKKHSELPRTGVTIAEIYRFTEALNSWMLRKQSSRLPKFGNARAFCRLPTEAEWAFAARGGIEVDRVIFDRPYPYSEELGEYEWHRGNTNSNIRECGSKHMQPNPIGLKDMLGNAEELTVSLFSPEYQQGRFGQFVIRGDNYSDSPDSFAVSHRIEFKTHTDDGKLRRSPKVGFRLALSTPVNSGDPQKLEKQFDQYLDLRSLTRPGLVGKSSPAAQAKEDNIHYLEEQLERIKADKKRLDAEISRLEKLRNNDHKKHVEREQANRDLRNAKQALEAKIAELQKQLIAKPKSDELHTLQRQFKEANAEIIRLQEKLRVSKKASDKVRPALSNVALTTKQNTIKELQQRLAAAPDPKKLQEVERQLTELKEKNKGLSAKLKDRELSEQQKRQKAFVSDSRLADLSQELKRKEQEIADLGRRQQLYEYEVTKNAGQVREVEKLKELQQRLAAAPDPKKLQEAKRQLTELKEKNKGLSAKLKDLELSEQQKRQKAFVSDSRLAKLSQELKRKEQEIADLGRWQQLYEYEVTKNAGMVREVEKLKEFQQRLAAAPDPKKLQETERQLTEIKEKNMGLSAKLKDLELSEQQKRQKAFVSDSRLADLSQELKRKEQEIADLGRRQQLYEY
ncbi:MAG: hypothetical protein D3917_17295, partial [Candidatus Electrothrix sp. AX5]|nr:hypothetical protein [Candidatus Electrothrix sp. AX5]